MRHTLKLQNERLTAVITPDLGGGLLSLSGMGTGGGSFDLLRPTDIDAARGPGDLACFLMAPYCNRIADGRFAVAGDDISLTPNFAPEPHAIHGVVWLSQFRVVTVDAARATLALDHAPTADWPWAMSCQAEYRLDGAALEIILSVTNADARPFPSGVGIHPYFPRPEQAHIKTDVAALIATDDRKLPADEAPDHPAVAALRSGNPLPIGLDNQLSEWSGEALISWSDREYAVHLSSQPSLRWAQIFTPEGEDFFCFEPVSHRVNGHNASADRLAETGVVILQPGETQAVCFRLSLATGRS
ncbi:MAG: aldose 1-epimerase [Pseudomonadota bacterium]